MSQTLSDLQEGLDAVVEAFTEVEDELESSVYSVFKPSLDKAQQSIMAVSTQLQNFAIIQDLLKEVSEAPNIELDRGLADSLLTSFRYQREIHEERLITQAPRQRRVARPITMVSITGEVQPVPAQAAAGFEWPFTETINMPEAVRQQTRRPIAQQVEPIRWTAEPE